MAKPITRIRLCSLCDYTFLPWLSTFLYPRTVVFFDILPPEIRNIIFDQVLEGNHELQCRQDGITSGPRQRFAFATVTQASQQFRKETRAMSFSRTKFIFEFVIGGDDQDVAYRKALAWLQKWCLSVARSELRYIQDVELLLDKRSFQIYLAPRQFRMRSCTCDLCAKLSDEKVLSEYMEGFHKIQETQNITSVGLYIILLAAIIMQAHYDDSKRVGYDELDELRRALSQCG